MPRRRCLVFNLDLVDYIEATKMQRELVRARQEGAIEDCLLLLRHPAVVTLGASNKASDVMTTQAELQPFGIPVFVSERGGKVTYHDPGQLVGYPIMDLRLQGKDLHRYLYSLEEMIILALRDYGIRCQRKRRYPGVWVGEGKIAAVGVAVRRWVSYHGFALNIDSDMSSFKLIDPCGLGRDSVVSIKELVSPLPTLDTLRNSLLYYFANVFNREIVQIHGNSIDTLECLTPLRDSATIKWSSTIPSFPRFV